MEFGAANGVDDCALAAGEHTGLLSNDEKEQSRLSQEFDDDDDGDGEELPEDVEEGSQAGMNPVIDTGKRQLQMEIEDAVRAKKHEDTVLDRLAIAQQLVDRIKKELHEAYSLRQAADAKVRHHKIKRHMMHPRTGPLEWVDGLKFSVLCTAVVILNLGAMLQHDVIPDGWAFALDNCFLLWYGVELMLKFGHHSWSLFFGPCIAVSWNWLDLGIVASGVLDQWIMPLLGAAVGTVPGGPSLAPLRVLRMFRLLRVVKVLRTFLVSDTDWINDNQKFDVFMAIVVSFNAVVMSFELDIVWAGWVIVDNTFQAVYFAELSLRLKRWGFHFFTHTTDWGWNWLDFGIVSAGMLDLWLLPGISLIQQQIFGAPQDALADEGQQLHNIMSLVRLTRLLRVLRLVRVLRSIPPLYTLLIGVIEAFKAMQWVIVLTLITLYGGAIVFTNLIGKGMIYPDHKVPEEAYEVFGTMARSGFSLFELMNGDTSVIKPIKAQMIGKFMFASFMVISNWAVLAILTAVVSENMISSSNNFAAEEFAASEEVRIAKSENRLLEIFEGNDPDKNGSITREEFADMIEDDAVRLELSEGSHLSRGDLLDLFDCLAVNDTGQSVKFKVEYRDLVHSLKANTTVADKRSVLHVMIRMRAMQDQVTAQMDARFEEMANSIQRIETHVRGEGASL